MSDENPDPVRAGIISTFLPQLIEMAHSAVTAGKRREDFIVVCVDIDEYPWEKLMKAFAQGVEVRLYSEFADMKIALAVMPMAFAEALVTAMPRLADGLVGALR